MWIWLGEEGLVGAWWSLLCLVHLATTLDRGNNWRLRGAHGNRSENQDDKGTRASRDGDGDGDGDVDGDLAGEGGQWWKG